MAYPDDIFGLVDSLSLIALESSLNPKLEDWLRYVFRYYSKTFHTPLAEVERLPLEYVVLAYFEERYWSYTEKEKDEAVLAVFKTQDPLKVEEEKAQEESEIEAMLQYAKERDAKRTLPEKEEPVPPDSLAPRASAVPRPERISRPTKPPEPIENEPEPLKGLDDDIFMDFGDL